MMTRIGFRSLAAPCLGMLALSCWAFGPSAAIGSTFTRFTAGDNTAVTSCNSTNAIAGSASNQAFLRAPNGTITLFGVPGAQLTGAMGINDQGTIAGVYNISQAQGAEGFVRASNGTITTFDVPGAAVGVDLGTAPTSINALGAIAGTYGDANRRYHNFIRAPDGTITTFDLGGGGKKNIYVHGINKFGTVVGIYGAKKLWYSFFRTSDGKFEKFAAPDAGTGIGQGTFAVGINDSAEIAGYYVNDDFSHGFLRRSDGTIVEFDFPGASATLPSGINNKGEIVGYYSSPGLPYLGFVRHPNGTISSFGNRFNSNQQINPPLCVNDQGVIAGNAFRPKSKQYDQGFIRIP